MQTGCIVLVSTAEAAMSRASCVNRLDTGLRTSGSRGRLAKFAPFQTRWGTLATVTSSCGLDQDPVNRTVPAAGREGVALAEGDTPIATARLINTATHTLLRSSSCHNHNPLQNDRRPGGQPTRPRLQTGRRSTFAFVVRTPDNLPSAAWTN